MDTQVTKTEAECRGQLTAAQYKVLRQAGTERPFTGRYVDCHHDGMYRCAACGAALFSSDAKFESGHGGAELHGAGGGRGGELHRDRSWGTVRTEVRCRRASRRRSPALSAFGPVFLGSGDRLFAAHRLHLVLV